MKFSLPDRVERFLAPPVYADEEATLRAGLLNITLLATAAFLALMLAYRLIVQPQRWTILLLDAGLLFYVFFLRELTRRGATIAASWGLIAVATLGVTLGMLISGRIIMPLIAAYLLIIVVAGLLLDYRVKIIMVLVNAAILLLLGLAHRAGLLAVEPPSNWLSWLLAVGVFAVAAAVIHVAKRQNNELLAYYRRELAERQRAETAKQFSDERLSSLLTAIPDFILTFSPDGEYKEVFTLNPLHFERRGLTREQLIGKNLTELFPAEQAASFQRIIERATRTGEVLEHEYQLQVADGNSAWYQARVAAYESPEGRKVVWLARDITENKAAQQALQQLTLELEQRVRDRTAQLETVNRELEAFAYSVSHDLRAPLRAVAGYGQLLDEDYGPSLPPEAQDLLARLRKGAQDMSKLIDSLLRLSRLANQPLERQSVSPAEIAGEAARLLIPAERVVRMQIDEMPAVQADPALLQRVYANLLENALKYTRPRPETVIQAGWLELDAERVFFVRDNGIGFDARYADRIFTAFQRLHSSGEFEGSGLGLAITRRIIERHGGRIWAEGRVNQGATFYFTLPAEG